MASRPAVRASKYGWSQPASLRILLTLSVLFAAAGASRPARAQEASHAGEDPRAAPTESAAPKQHFEEALVHYREGHYRAAIAELEAALTFDPTSKDLLYNLALVHEKLGQLEQAITALERYAELETDPKELDRARQAVVRMRGARAELGPPIVAPRVPMPLPSPPPAAARGSVDGWFAAAAGVSVTAAVVGILFGIRALTLRPSHSAGTNAGTSIDALRSRQGRAEDSARVADISFAISLVSGAGAAVLWLRDSSPCPHPRVGSGPLSVRVEGSF
jgi:tetratricopeptide (TPR) repeat protein